MREKHPKAPIRGQFNATFILYYYSTEIMSLTRHRKEAQNKHKSETNDGLNIHCASYKK